MITREINNSKMDHELENISLSRLQITETVTENCPLVVLIEIANAHGILVDNSKISSKRYLRNLVIDINQGEVVTVPSRPHETSHYQYIARFINNSCSWPRNLLNEAFLFLRGFMNSELSELPGTNFAFGPQKPECTKSYNACMLYKICRQNNITLTPETTLEQMANFVRMLSIPFGNLQTTLIQNLVSIPKSAIINMLSSTPDLFEGVMSTPSESNQGVIGIQNTTGNNFPANNNMTFTQLENCHRQLQDIKNLHQRLLPLTDEEAIILAAINYKIDLTMIRDPRYEYLNIQRNVSAGHPLDDTHPSIRSNFNPLLPRSVYSDSDLLVLAVGEGFTREDFLSSHPYELLQLAYLSETFYHGRQQFMANRETPINLESIEELPNDSIICYGCRNNQGSIIAYRYSELTETFSRSKNFSNPMSRSGEIFDDRSLKKLKILCQTRRQTDTDDTRAERNRLLDVILEVEIFAKDGNSKARDFYEVYQRSDTKTKRQIQKTMELLFELSMALRGYLGKGPYPIKQAPVDNQHEVDIRVTDAISKFEENCRELGQIGLRVMTLPLLRYRCGFQMSSDPSDGLTIGDRLKIIKAGNGVASCIRLSSNWMAASAYRYMQVIGMIPPFKIEQLANIG